MQWGAPRRARGPDPGLDLGRGRGLRGAAQRSPPARCLRTDGSGLGLQPTPPGARVRGRPRHAALSGAQSWRAGERDQNSRPEAPGPAAEGARAAQVPPSSGPGHPRVTVPPEGTPALLVRAPPASPVPPGLLRPEDEAGSGRGAQVWCAAEVGAPTWGKNEGPECGGPRVMTGWGVLRALQPVL